MTHSPTTAPTTTTAEWRALDAAHHLHPFSDTLSLNETGVRVITGGKGVWLTDSDGNQIIDGMSGLWCVNVGYGRTELVDAAAKQMSELPFYNTFFKTTTPAATTLATLLSEVTPPGFKHVFFGSSGSESNDTIIRMVRHYWRTMGQPSRQTIISRYRGYHGSTLAGASLGGMDAMHTQAGMLPGFAHIQPPHWFQLGFDKTEDEFGIIAAGWLEDKILELGPENVAAFIGEPIQGAGGVIIPPDTYWPEIQRICTKYGILLIADEVICGFGRLGTWFGSDYYNIKPDFMTMAKGISSGYLPISGVMVHDRVADVLIGQGGEFHHGYTYSGHPVAAAVAIANIGLLREGGIVERAASDIGPYFQARLQELADHPLVGQVRGKGMIAAIELIKNKKNHTFFPNAGKVGTVCRDHCFRNNIIMRACWDTMVLAPPLVMTHEEIDILLARARLALDLTAKDVL